MSVTELDFTDVTPKKVPVKISDTVTYTLHEAPAKAIIEYRNAVAACRVYQDGKLVAMKGMASTDLLLLSLCMTDEKGKPAQLAVMEQWPNNVVKTLLETLRMISGLDEELPDERISLEKCLEQPGTPVTFKALQEFILQLSGKEYIPAKLLFQLKTEEQLKNS